jgi:hypothetical protein
MNTQEQIEDIKYMLSRNHTTPEEEIQKLTNTGTNENHAKEIVAKIVKEIKHEQFNQRVEYEENEAKRSIGLGIIVFAAVIGPIADITSPIWYLVAIIIAGGSGYYGYSKKPFAGVLGGIIFVISLPFAWSMYFANRESFIRIELAIPMLMAGVPAFLGYFVASFFYSES